MISPFRGSRLGPSLGRDYMESLMRLPFLTVALLSLAACTIDPQTGKIVDTSPITEELQPVSYAAVTDGGFNIPALDASKIPEQFQRRLVNNPLPDEVPGTILVDTQTRHLYLIQDKRTALRYGIGVGKDGFGWAGETIADRKARWPTWTPPPEMIKRTPSLERWKDGQPGGLKNPLGARAIYLYKDGHDTGFRIHGTPDWRSIGTSASSGCFRMIQQDVIDLYNRVAPGAKVIVR